MRSKPKNASASGVASRPERTGDAAGATTTSASHSEQKATRSRARRSAGDEDPGQMLDQATRDLIKRAILSELTLAERLLLVLRYAEGMSLAEVASTMQISVDEATRSLERIVGRIGTSVAVA